MLHADSHHPRSLIRGTPVGQFLHIRRNCSTNDDYRRKSKSLYQRFRERGYSHRILKRAKRIVGQRTRADLLAPRTGGIDTLSDPVRFITPYGIQWQQVGSILSDHWHILTRSDTLKAIVGDRPHMVAKRVRNLKDDLVESSEFRRPINRNWLTDMLRLQGMFPCGHCATCKLVDALEHSVTRTQPVNTQLNHSSTVGHAGSSTSWNAHVTGCMSKQNASCELDSLST